MKGKTLVITGTAMVTFRKVISGMDDDEIAELQDNSDNVECNIDFEDCRDIEYINDYKLEVR